ncbi:alpha/beta hydrolase [Lewinella sp. IMCC34191]|uniref:alpha/beta hydrolase n=1 Tax=Lewinella sp. IMCC34191 TaxID=2259172 RepID=UPI000E258FA6|nr:alpha/beta hydrolase [Lewinella sp. IMCC34191]
MQQIVPFLTLIFFLGGLPGLMLSTCATAQNTYTTLEDVNYRPDSTDAYIQERCVLDLYYPEDSAGFATVVFFHGGGLSGGEKFTPEQWLNQGIAVATANYRLHPRVTNPAYTRDAAAAVAWVMEHIDDYGGDPRRIYVSGHSAGGYLTSMIGLDTTYLAAHGLHPDSLAGLIPFSGHTITHFTPRQERGLDWNDVVVDRYAPIQHLRPDAPPMLIITGDRDRELYGRYEENAYFWRMLQLSGHPNTWLYEMQGFDHGGMARPAAILTLDFIRGRL